ncbi:MAG: DUF4258 domain-containing protein [Thermomicrobiales bacterium]
MGQDVRIRYDPHARRRMQARGISEGEVEAVLASPEITRPGHSGRTMQTTHPNGRFIKVVFTRLPDDTLYIITAAD